MREVGGLPEIVNVDEMGNVNEDAMISGADEEIVVWLQRRWEDENIYLT